MKLYVSLSVLSILNQIEQSTLRNLNEVQFLRYSNIDKSLTIIYVHWKMSINWCFLKRKTGAYKTLTYSSIHRRTLYVSSFFSFIKHLCYRNFLFSLSNKKEIFPFSFSIRNIMINLLFLQEWKKQKALTFSSVCSSRNRHLFIYTALSITFPTKFGFYY